MSETAMRTIPILFTGEMVRAILDGRKTQTRRVVKPQPVNEDPSVKWGWAWRKSSKEWFSGVHEYQLRKAFGLAPHCPYGLPGDRLWVRETHVFESSFGIELDYKPPFDDGRPVLWEEDEEWGRWWTQPHYRATDPVPDLCCESSDEPVCRWRPSIHMPRWASRITLEVTGVRVERVQEITEADAMAEGVNGGCLTCGNPDPCGCDDPNPDHRESFIYLWNSINAKRGYSWASNPWVWVVDFEKVTP